MEFQEIKEAMQLQDYGPGMTEGGLFLNKMDITFDPKSETYRKFGAFMNQSILMFTKNAIEELKGVKAALAMPNMAAHGAGAMPNGLTGPISLEKLFEKYLADPSQPRNKKTYENYIVAGSVLNKNY